MNRDEVVDLLSAITAYDNRTPAEATVLAWTEAADRGRWTFREALEAVHQHFVESTEWLMPAHITALVKSARLDQEMRLAALEPPDVPADPARVEAVIAQVATELGWERDNSPNRRAVAVGCPYCHAPAGVQCQSPTGHRLTQTACHPARVSAYSQQQAAS